MSFTTGSTFSTNYQSMGSVQVPSYGAQPVSSAASVYAGAGGLWFPHLRVPLHQLPGGMAAGIWQEWEASRTRRRPHNLVSYPDRVRSLETENLKLESKIQENLEKKGPQVRDWSHYFKTMEDLRAQIFANTVDNTCIVLQIHSACLAVDDFRVKYETELAMRQSVESHIHGLHKVIDDTNVTGLQLETEIEAVKEEPLFMKKNHERK
ncbi:Keratin, type I cytoskeletal 18 [Saguinus oedipus]|uniref:Keratin, type I cytoskeletal 18 n=1 Tax=Saguinus oedipus TaxID=9490 RepID=A0ABQ9THV8_SAGOE|nr:Keratin, type I cytoskeletal 18 [Saguinus oedipus]